MALADNIRMLWDRILADLTAAHDYYMDTKAAWEIIDHHIADGKTFTVRNIVTGTETTQDDLKVKIQGYITQHLAEATFQQFISIFEGFFLEFLQLWLMSCPKSLCSKKLDFKEILEATDKDAIIVMMVNKELHELSYSKTADWFKYLGNLVNLSCPAADEIDRIVEAKASRDILVHNSAMANKTYESKAGRLARFKDGERIDIPEHYHRQTWELIRKVVSDISNAGIAKAP
jgi:hypothetical protein